VSTSLRTIVLVAILVVVPVAVTWWLAERPDELAGVTDPIEAVIVEPTVQVDVGSQAVDVVLDWAEPVSVAAPVRFSGFVTRVFVGSGDRVVSGDVVVQVDGIDRIAWHSAAPLYRRLGRNVEGSDVEELHRLLSSTLSDVTLEGDVYTLQTAAAVDVFAERLGVSDARGVFDPSWVIWLPEEDSVVGTPAMQAGQDAPPAGSVLWDEPVALMSARVVRPGTRDDLGVFDGTEWVVSVDGTDLFDTTTPGISDSESLRLIEGVAASGAEAIGGTIRRRVPVDVLAVPVGSVQAGKDGEACVWLPDGGQYRPVAVDVRGGGPGYVVIGGITADTELLANPALVLDDPTCRS